MTRAGARKPADTAFGESRLHIARAFHSAAERLLASATDPDIGNPAVSLIVSAAVAYADALTARFGGVVSQGEHGGVVKILRDTLGNRLPASKEHAFKRIIDRKSVAQYGHRILLKSDAAALLVDLDGVSKWVETRLDGRQ